MDFLECKARDKMAWIHKVSQDASVHFSMKRKSVLDGQKCDATSILWAKKQCWSKRSENREKPKRALKFGWKKPGFFYGYFIFWWRKTEIWKNVKF